MSESKSALCFRFGKYELHDLVVLDQQTTGIIVSVDKETCRVLTTEVHLQSPVLTQCIIQVHKQKLENPFMHITR